jgi:adenosine deaminase
MDSATNTYSPAVMSAAPTSVDQRFARRLPKIELHAHLTGSISRDCLHHIWAAKHAHNPAFDVDDPLLAIPSDKVDYNLETCVSPYLICCHDSCSRLFLPLAPRRPARLHTEAR